MSKSDAHTKKAQQMIKPFTAEERQASKQRDKANRPWTMHWRTRCQSEKQAKVINGEVEDHLELEHKQKQ